MDHAGSPAAALLAAVLLLLCTPGTAEADDTVPERGTHLTHEEATVRLGPWRDYSVWTYRVRAGDTLSEIAQEQLGTLRRQDAIEALNPGLEPHRLKPGQPIAMPPRKKPAPYGAAPAKDPGAARPWWDFYVLPVYDDGETGPTRVGSGDGVPWHRDGVTLFAVRHDQASKVLQAVAAAPGRASDVLERFALDGVVATSREVLGGRRVVDGESPVHYGMTTYDVRGITAGRIELVRGHRRELDENRMPLEQAGAGFGSIGLALLLVVVGALVVGVVLLRRRAGGFELPVSSGT